mmetsp:Transcript_28919/g.94539  ORF Transcript_28919/g.94539 Transcript_28919/m.94539 type:complete len:212 (-) Transcript_28919:1089-1724(-)
MSAKASSRKDPRRGRARARMAARAAPAGVAPRAAEGAAAGAPKPRAGAPKARASSRRRRAPTATRVAAPCSPLRTGPWTKSSSTAEAPNNAKGAKACPKSLSKRASQRAPKRSVSERNEERVTLCSTLPYQSRRSQITILAAAESDGRASRESQGGSCRLRAKERRDRVAFLGMAERVWAASARSVPSPGQHLQPQTRPSPYREVAACLMA